MSEVARFAASSTCREGAPLVIVYDLDLKKVVWEVSEYSYEMGVKQQLSKLTVDKRIGQIMYFWAWLCDERRAWHEVSDTLLIKFRNQDVRRVLSRPSSRDHEMTAKRTVNDRVSTVLGWLRWLASWKEKSFDELTFPEDAGLWQCTPGPRVKKRSSMQHAPPSLFRQVGNASRHKTSAAMSEKGVEGLHVELLAGASHSYLAQRNTLIVEIAENVGLRRGSINSLDVEQFQRAELELAGGGAILIRPRKQKFGYQFEFAFPVWLAMKICDFIEEPRAELVVTKGVAQRKHQGKVFLSARDAKPITDRAITSLISAAMKAGGAPKGASLHALRAKFANDQIHREIEARRSLGLDTSAAAIAAAVALRMGHTSLRSLYAYVAAAQSMQGMADTAMDGARSSYVLEAKLHSTRVELERLRKKGRLEASK
jgi:integrase